MNPSVRTGDAVPGSAVTGGRRKRIGFCGDECSSCPRYLATLAEDEGELERVARLWHAVGFRDRVVTTAEIRRDGCSPGHDCAHGIAACAGARAVGLYS